MDKYFFILSISFCRL